MVADSATGVRVSDEDRERAATRLRDGAADGRITLGELSERLEGAYDARTRADLARVTADLPAQSEPDRASHGPRHPPSWSISLIGGTRRAGRWRPGERMRMLSLIGGTDLDLRQAELDGPELTLESFSLIGGMRIIVPPGVEVDVSGLSLIGGTRDDAGSDVPRPGAPLVRVHVFSLIGGVRIARGDEDPATRRSLRRSRRR